MTDNLTLISGILGAYKDPKLFTDDFKVKLKKGENFDEKKIEKYHQLLLNIGWFLKKVSRYQVYFEKFYSTSEEIPDFEELEHHVHAYLEDISTVKNKIFAYIGALKNDINQIASNKKEAKEALEFITKQVYKTFESLLILRGDHRHNGYRFVDNNLVSAENAYMMLGEKSPFKGMLNDYAIEKFTNERRDSFNKAKSFWIENAMNNYPQVLGISNEVINKTKSLLFLLLDIDVSEIELFLKDREDNK